MASLDELAIFKECMINLQNTQNEFYTNLMQLLSGEKLSKLDVELQKAMSITKAQWWNDIKNIN